MATIYRCDRCSLETTKQDEMNRLEFEYRADPWRDAQDILKKDLCYQCAKGLAEYCKLLPEGLRTK